MVLNFVNELQKQDLNFMNIYPCSDAWVVLCSWPTCRLSLLIYYQFTRQRIQNVSLEDCMIKLYSLEEFSRYWNELHVLGILIFLFLFVRKS